MNNAIDPFDSYHIHLIREHGCCPKECNASHDDLDDGADQDQDLDSAYHNDPWEGENIEDLLTLDEDDDLWNYEDYEEEYDPLHYL